MNNTIKTLTEMRECKPETVERDYGSCPMYPGESCLGGCWHSGVQLVTWQRCVAQHKAQSPALKEKK